MLAEITIPDIWSLRSALCVVGIIYMVVCFYIVGTRGFGGWATVLSLWVCGVIILMIMTPDPVGFDGPKDGWSALEPRVFNDRGESVDLKSLMNERNYDEGMIIKKWDGDKIAGYHIDYEVFAMHDKQADCFYINPFIFHPTCLFWCPLFIVFLTGSSWFATGNK